MGPSGSGKSTMLNMLGCLDVPTSGSYYLDGQEVSRLSRKELATVRAKKIGFVFQQFNLLPRLSALSNVLLGMEYADIDDKKIAMEALTLVGLADRAHHRPYRTLGGRTAKGSYSSCTFKKNLL